MLLWGNHGGTLTFWGSRRVRDDSIGLGVPQGRALKVLRRTEQGGAVLGVSRPIGYPTIYRCKLQLVLSADTYLVFTK